MVHLQVHFPAFYWIFRKFFQKASLWNRKPSLTGPTWWLVTSIGTLLWLVDTTAMWFMFPNNLSNFLQVYVYAFPPTARIPDLVSLPQQYTGLIFSSLEKNYSFVSTSAMRLFNTWIFFFFLWPRHSIVLKDRGQESYKGWKCNLYLLSGKPSFTTRIAKLSSSSLCWSLVCAEVKPRSKSEDVQISI